MPAVSAPLANEAAPRSDSGLAGPWPPCPSKLLDWLRTNQQGLVAEWVERLGVLSPNYRQRPQEELFYTVTNAFEANLHALAGGRMEPMV